MNDSTGDWKKHVTLEFMLLIDLVATASVSSVRSFYASSTEMWELTS